MRNWIIIAIASVAMFACGDGGTPVEDPGHGFVVGEADSLIMLDEPGFQIGFLLPKDLMIANDAQVGLNTATGTMEIRLGAKFQLDITQEALDIEGLKAELADDQFFSYKFMDETETSMMYQPVLPDGQAFFYHYVEELTFDSVVYAVRTPATGEFALESIKKMKQCIQSIKPV